MRTLIAIVAATAMALLAIGCAGTDESTPVACREGAPVYRKALRAAPGVVKLAGQTLISDCLVENQQVGDLATVGSSMIALATKLNTDARADPGDAANVEVGYLIGAAQRGSERTDGIHTELIRRLSVASRYSPEGQPLPPAFLAAYRRGYLAGHLKG
jgi:hypothetical protein